MAGTARVRTANTRKISAIYTSSVTMYAKIANGARADTMICDRYWPKERLQALDALNHRQHHFSGSISVEITGTEI